MTTKQTGERGEAVAAGYLESQGYHILARNYRFKREEVDLVCRAPGVRDGSAGELVFVEVKARARVEYGRPEEAVTWRKQRRIVRAARAYLHEHRLAGTPVRFDVIAIVLDGRRAPQIEHFEDAFWAG